MAGTPAAFQPNAFQNDAFQTGDITPPSPSTGGGGGSGYRRRYIVYNDGSRREIYDDADLQRVVRDLIDREEREEVAPPQKKTKKIRRLNKSKGILQNFALWDTLYARLGIIEVINESALLETLLNLARAQQIKEDDEEVMLLLGMVQ